MKRYFFLSYWFKLQHGSIHEQGFGNVCVVHDNYFQPMKAVREILLAQSAFSNVVIQNATEIDAEAWIGWNEGIQNAIAQK
jgi:hypothetical protein